MRTLRIEITPEQAGRTIESLLKNELCCSSGHISRLKRREAGVLLCGERKYVTARVSAGETLEIEIGDEPGAGAVLPMPYPLSVVYEDDDLLLLDKVAGMEVHPARDLTACTLENAVCAHLGGNVTPHPVSRLDRGTSGLILFAKSGYVHEKMRRALHTDAFFRAYRGIAVGVVQPPKGAVNAPIGFAPDSHYKRAVAADGKEALTEYATLETNERFTLLRLVPQTGRTHQLRVHMAYLGYPLAGDFLYGTEDPSLIQRPALHSSELSFVHPVTGETLTFSSPLPSDMARLMTLSRGAL